MSCNNCPVTVKEFSQLCLTKPNSIHIKLYLNLSLIIRCFVNFKFIFHTFLLIV
jgi:hypothetical protein